MGKCNLDNLVIENAKIIFRNFSGAESKYNRAGDRNFCIKIEDEEESQKLIEDGWNVKIKNPKDSDRDPYYFIKVSVSYRYYAPKVYLVTKRNKVLLDEETISELDRADILNVDLVVRPSEWEVNGKTGIKAYLKTMYVTIEEDEFVDKYSRPDNDDDDEMPFD